MIFRAVVVASSVDPHAHPAALLTEAAGDSDVDITIAFGGEEANAASLLEIITLGVGHGDEVTLSTDDDNADVILDSLVKLLS